MSTTKDSPCNRTNSNSNNSTTRSRFTIVSAMNRQIQIAHQRPGRKKGKLRQWKWMVGIAFALTSWSSILRSQDLEQEFSFSYVDTITTSTTTNNKKKNVATRTAAADSAAIRLPDPERTKICFVQSVFGERTHRSMDRPHNVTSLKQDSADYEFYYFTNMEELRTPGWTKVLLTDLPYQRHITMSRLPKFLAWKIHKPILETCRIVIYLDGHFRPRDKKQIRFDIMAHQVRGANYGLIHTTHPKGGSLTDEFERIVSGTKDTSPHVEASLQWLRAQPDWYDNCTLYWNAVFGYDPTNEWYQNASMFFWDRFSQEVDSWRDQPLWAYTLHHFGMEPLEMRHDTLHSYIVEDLDLKGNHHYTESTVSYAKQKIAKTTA